MRRFSRLTEKDWESELRDLNHEEHFGVFVNPMQNGMKRTPDMLKSLIEEAHSVDLPVFFHETESSFFNYDQSSFLCAGSNGIEPDGVYFYPGEQLGVVAVRDEYFIKTPLMMISTWDGDEHSLSQMRERLIDSLKTAEAPHA